MATRTVNFTGPAASGNQTITLTSSPEGRTPVGAIFCFTGATAADTRTAHSRFSIGMTDGTNHRCIAIFEEDNTPAGSADTQYLIDTATVMQLTNTTTGALSAEASFVSFGTDSVTVNWSATTGSRLGWVTFIYGEQCNVTSFASSNSVGSTKETTAPGFPPDLVIAACCNRNFVADGAGNEAMLSIGFAGRTPSITQCCAVTVAEDRQSNTAAGGLVRNDALVSTLLSSAGTVSENVRLELASFTSTGWSITTRNVSAALEAMYMSVRLSSPTVWCGVDTVNSDTAGSTSSTSAGFKGRQIFSASSRVTTVNTVVTGGGGFGFGVASASEVAAAGFHWQHNAATSDANVTKSSAKLVTVPESSSADDWVASFTSLDNFGYTLNIDDTSGADRPTAFVIYDPAPGLGNDTETLSDDFVARLAAAQGETEDLADGFAAGFRSVQAETEDLADGFALALSAPTSETEELSDAQVFAASTASAESEELLDTAQFALIVPSPETEDLSDGVQFALSAPFEETEILSDDYVVVLATAVGDIEEITDGFVTVEAATADEILASTEDEELDDGFVLTGSIVVAFDETMDLSESAYLYAGNVLSTSDTEDISEQANFGAGPGRMRSTPRGTVLAPGGLQGAVFGAGSKRGRVR